jgi:hypothetical protein
VSAPAVVNYWELSCGQCGAVIGLAADAIHRPNTPPEDWLADMRDGDALRRWPVSRPAPAFGDCPHLKQSDEGGDQ